MKKWIATGVALVLAVLLPLIWWALTPSKELQSLIIDKTIPDETYREHKGLVWLMNHKKYVKENGDTYDLSRDYIGYHPAEENHPPLPDDLSGYDFLYLADTYGVETEKGNAAQGLSLEEAERIAASLRENPRPFVAEFNTFADPTGDEAAAVMETLLDVETTGWRGRYFASLEAGDTSEVPDWAVRNFEERDETEWTFDGPGYLLTHEDGDLLVLESGEDLEEEDLSLTFTEKGAQQFGMKRAPSYPYWFDIVQPSREENVLASFEWNLTGQGASKLEEAGLPSTFPAVTKTKNGTAPSYYFAGDFADITDLPDFKRAKGLLSLMKWRASDEPGDPSAFYWRTYVPMMEDILKEAEQFNGKEERKTASSTPSSPARIESGEFQIYKDGEWTTELVKGVNMGMAKPGTFPGEAAITEQEYERWFQQISDMNANALRVYTRHPPGFYRALEQHNAGREDPLYVFHGVWAEEEPLVESLDSFNEESTSKFRREIENLIDVVHGNAEIEAQSGHASGSYTADVSDYIAGWIIGVEWYPQMVKGTNDAHNGLGEYDGDFIYTEGAAPFEHWLASMMDHTIRYEKETYNEERPMSFTNWVTTDLLDHPSEPLPQEDLASVDPNVMKTKDSFTHGMFASYHVYPYYPDFLNYDEAYLEYTDHRGKKNSYAGYLNDLISQHDMPVLIAEFGVPGSRGMTHENPFGLDQGHHSEKEQGEINRRLFEDIVEEGSMGGLVFTWQDEWFKRTWNTMDLDDPDRRPYWSNAETNEQQFGLLSFDRLKRTIDGKGDSWKDRELTRKESGTLRSLAVDHDEKYLYLRLEAEESFSFDDHSLTVVFDTIDNQGITKNDSFTTDQGIDFRLDMKGREEASLTVDSYYDPFYYQYGEILESIEKKPYASEKDNGTFHPIRLALNKELTLPASGEVIPFTSYETGKLLHGNADPDHKEYNSLTDYSIGEGIVEIRIPWLLLNVKDPSTKQQLADLYEEGLEGSRNYESIRMAALVTDKENQPLDILPEQSPETIRSYAEYSYEPWDTPAYEERLKRSYDIMKETFGEYR